MALRRMRDADARPFPRATVLAGSLAGAVTAAVVALGVLGGGTGSVALVADDPADTAPASVAQIDSPAARTADLSTEALKRELEPLSRAAQRGPRLRKPTRLERTMAPAAVREAIAGAQVRRWSTTDLNLWSGPSKDAASLGLLADTKRVLVTGRTLMGRQEIVLGGKARWVTAGYLAADKPRPEPPPAPASSSSSASSSSGSSSSSRSSSSPSRSSSAPAPTASCSNGSSVPSGVSPNIVKVHQAVCAAFPSITAYGTFRSDGEHAQGIAVDIMVSGSTGYQVADFVRARAGSLGVSYIIYAQRIWSVQRGGEGWRGMSDRGSTTANHYDHVHVTTY